MRSRSGAILMLQGPPCRFWRELGAAFREAGRPVHHVGFSLGDRLWWRAPGGTLYRGTLADWPARLGALIDETGATDILYYADRVPYHRAAIDVARARNLRAWTVENGYLRPDWLTLEPEAMGAYSRLARSPAAIRAAADRLTPPDLTPWFRHAFWREAASEVGYNLAAWLGGPLTPRFVPDKRYAPPLDYLGWLRKWAFEGGARRAAATAERLARQGRPLFLLALQLESDYQIRCSSRDGSLGPPLEQTIASFAAHAPRESTLIVKQHPMDNGWERWPRRVRGLARRHGVSERVIAADGGALALFLRSASGVVTVNSTVGLLALTEGCPVIALGDAVYDMPGLTHQGTLSQFWQAPEPVSQSLLAAFCAVLADRVQVRGSFYDPAGRRAAIGEIVRRVEMPERYWRLDRPLCELGPKPRPRDAAQAHPLIAAE